MRTTDLTNARMSQTVSEFRNPAATGRVAIIGGGQLARMTALAAAPLGCEVVTLEAAAGGPAAQVTPRAMTGAWADAELLAKLAAGADVVTLENEFVDAGALRRLEAAGHVVRPGSACLALTQDKLRQKETVAAAGLPVPGFCAVASPAEVLAAAEKFGWPLVLKTRRNGYDGKGNYTVRSAAEVEAGWAALRGGVNELMVEAFFHFVKELAVIITRRPDGATAVYPVVETVQRNHVCNTVQAPAQIAPELAAHAAEVAMRAVTAVGGVGSFGVELFLAASGEVVVNELAPRVHNSGHYTIEACECSQFENHVRAVLGWPLGSTRMVAPAAVMVNLLGTRGGTGRPRGLEQALAVPGAHVHLYGKATSGAGRKLGHVTALGATMAEAMAAAQRSADAIQFGEPT